MRKKILIVEDNRDLNRLMAKLLECSGYDCIMARTGKEALDMAAEHLPDLITLDIMLPDQDGLTAARQIRENPKTRSIPILAVTASFYTKQKECLENGCNAYISKPFSNQQLLSSIENVLNQTAPSELQR